REVYSGLYKPECLFYVTCHHIIPIFDCDPGHPKRPAAMYTGQYSIINICNFQMKRKHRLFQKQAQEFMPTGNMLCNRSYMQTHWIKNFIDIMELKELNFFINEIFIAFKKFREKYRHKQC